MSPNNEFAIGLFSITVSDLDIKPIMIADNLTLGEMIWLLFELVLIVLRTRNNKTVFTYKEVALYKPPF